MAFPVSQIQDPSQLQTIIEQNLQQLKEGAKKNSEFVISANTEGIKFITVATRASSDTKAYTSARSILEQQVKELASFPEKQQMANQYDSQLKKITLTSSSLSRKTASLANNYLSRLSSSEEKTYPKEFSRPASRAPKVKSEQTGPTEEPTFSSPPANSFSSTGYDQVDYFIQGVAQNKKLYANPETYFLLPPGKTSRIELAYIDGCFHVLRYLREKLIEKDTAKNLPQGQGILTEAAYQVAGLGLQDLENRASPLYEVVKNLSMNEQEAMACNTELLALCVQTKEFASIIHPVTKDNLLNILQIFSFEERIREVNATLENIQNTLEVKKKLTDPTKSTFEQHQNYFKVPLAVQRKAEELTASINKRFDELKQRRGSFFENLFQKEETVKQKALTKLFETIRDEIADIDSKQIAPLRRKNKISNIAFESSQELTQNLRKLLLSRLEPFNSLLDEDTKKGIQSLYTFCNRKKEANRVRANTILSQSRRGSSVEEKKE